MKKTITNYRRVIILFTLIIVVLIILVNAWYPLAAAVKIVLGICLSLFLPGLFFSYIFFPETTTLQNTDSPNSSPEQVLDMIERFILSVFLSMTIVTLALVFFRRVHIPLTTGRVAIIIISINILAIIGVWHKSRKQK